MNGNQQFGIAEETKRRRIAEKFANEMLALDKELEEKVEKYVDDEFSGEVEPDQRNRIFAEAAEAKRSARRKAADELSAPSEEDAEEAAVLPDDGNDPLTAGIRALENERNEKLLAYLENENGWDADPDEADAIIRAAENGKNALFREAEARKKAEAEARENADAVNDALVCEKITRRFLEIENEVQEKVAKYVDDEINGEAEIGQHDKIYEDAKKAQLSVLSEIASVRARAIGAGFAVVPVPAADAAPDSPEGKIAALRAERDAKVLGILVMAQGREDLLDELNETIVRTEEGIRRIERENPPRPEAEEKEEGPEEEAAPLYLEGLEEDLSAPVLAEEDGMVDKPAEREDENAPAEDEEAPFVPQIKYKTPEDPAPEPKIEYRTPEAPKAEEKKEPEAKVEEGEEEPEGVIEPPVPKFRTPVSLDDIVNEAMARREEEEDPEPEKAPEEEPKNEEAENREKPDEPVHTPGFRIRVPGLFDDEEVNILDEERAEKEAEKAPEKEPEKAPEPRPEPEPQPEPQPEPEKEAVEPPMFETPAPDEEPEEKHGREWAEDNQAKMSEAMDRAEAEAQASVNEAKAAIGRQLDRAFGVFEKSNSSRADYVFIDGRPASALISEYCEETKNDLNAGQRKDLVPELVLAAQLNGSRVSFARLDPADGSFSPDRIEELPLTDEYRAAAGNRVIADAFGRKGASAVMPKEKKLAPAQADEAQNRTNALLARLSLIDRQNHVNNGELQLRKDLFADIERQTDRVTGEKETDAQILERMESKGIPAAFTRYSFTTHAFGWLVSQGYDPETIFDPEKGKALRAEAGKKVCETVMSGNCEDFVRLNIEASTAVCDLLDRELSKVDLGKEETLFDPKTIRLLNLANMNYDLLQERGRFRDEAYTVLAKKKGLDPETPEGREGAEKEYKDLTARSRSLGFVNDVLKGERRAVVQALGAEETSKFRDYFFDETLKSHFLRTMISRAQKNGQPVSRAISDEMYAETTVLEDSLRGNADDPESMTVYGRMKSVRTRREAMALADRMLSQDFRDGFRFRSVQNGEKVTLGLRESAAGLSDPSDHAAKDASFYSATFRTPVNRTFRAETEAEAERFDRCVSATLKTRFGITPGRKGSDRLYTTDASGALVPVALGAQMNGEDRARLRDLAISHRLFAIPENEAVPVQLRFGKSPENGEWKAGAADMLDAPVRPVSYGFLDRIGNFFGAQSSVALRKEYEKENARARMAASISRIRQQRAPLVTAEAIGRRMAAEEKAKTDEVAKKAGELTGDLNGSLRAIADIYGSHPRFRDECVAKGSYTKEEFDSLRVPDVELGTDDDMRHFKNGKLVITESDFIGLSMAAASSPDLAGVMRRDEDNENIDPVLASDTLSTMYLNDLAMNRSDDGKSFNPRPNLGKYIRNTIAPARERAAQAIREYRAGNPDKLAGLIADGLAFYSRNMMHRCDDLSACAVKRYMSNLTSMMNADPELKKAVTEKAAQISENAKKELAAVRAEKERFSAENGRYMDSVAKELEVLNSAANALHGVKGREEEYRRACENAHDFYHKDNPGYAAMRERSAVLTGLEKYHETNASFSLEMAEKRVSVNEKVTDAIASANEARAKLMIAAAEKKDLPKEEKEACVRDIFYAAMLRKFESANLEKGQDAGYEAFSTSKEYAPLFERRYQPARRSYDEKLGIEDDKAAQKTCTVGDALAVIFNNSKTMNTFSQVTDLVLDPMNGRDNFDKIYEKVVPDAGKWAEMDPAVLLKQIGTIPDSIDRAVEKHAAEKHAAEKHAAEKHAAEKQKIPAFHVEEKVNDKEKEIIK